MTHSDRGFRFHFLGMVCAVLILVSSTASATASWAQTEKDSCRKLSTRLSALLQTIDADTARVDVIILLNDSSGVAEIVPSVRISSQHLGMGKLTVKEISILCGLPQVASVTVPKKLSPNKQPDQ